METTKLFILLIIGILTILNSKAEKLSNEEDDGFGASLIQDLRNDVNLDLPNDEEYEDLRAELLAYHTTLAKLSEVASTRRALISKPCWQMHGICIDVRLCRGFKYRSQVLGCRDRNRVCCFSWNKYQVKDLREFDIKGVFPWGGLKHEYGGGQGIIKVFNDGTKENLNKTMGKNQRLKLMNQFDISVPEDENEQQTEKKEEGEVGEMEATPLALEVKKASNEDEVKEEDRIEENNKNIEEIKADIDVDEAEGDGGGNQQENEEKADGENEEKADGENEEKADGEKEEDENVDNTGDDQENAEDKAEVNEDEEEKGPEERVENPQVKEVIEEGDQRRLKNYKLRTPKHQKSTKKGKVRAKPAKKLAKRKPSRRSSLLKSILDNDNDDVSLQFSLDSN